MSNFTSSPSKKCVANDARGRNLRKCRCKAKSRLGTTQTAPPSAAEIPPRIPTMRPTNAATTKVAAICRFTTRNITPPISKCQAPGAGHKRDGPPHSTTRREKRQSSKQCQPASAIVWRKLTHRPNHPPSAVKRHLDDAERPKVPELIVIFLSQRGAANTIERQHGSVQRSRCKIPSS